MALRLFRRRHTALHDIDPDEIFLDAHNLPDFDTQQFEGTIERPIAKFSLRVYSAVILILMLALLTRAGLLQVARGAEYRTRAENNTLRHIPSFAPRGSILDRNAVPLAWSTATGERNYSELPGLTHLLGYLGKPDERALAAGAYPDELVGKQGIEKVYGDVLRGQHGLKIEEIDVSGAVESSAVLALPQPGLSLTTSIDSRVQSKLYSLIAELAEDKGFRGGAGIIMDVHTGELLALVSYPEYQVKELERQLTSEETPFLNRAIAGLFTPGSVVKPFIASAALEEGVARPETTIVSTGALTLPNPYHPDQPSVFKDWKAHGATDLRHALAVSSDVYFYQIGGGYRTQRGLGIKKIDEYAARFELAGPTGIDLDGEAVGVIPTPEWKEEHFPGDPWTIGNTYHTAIGQYGFQVTPLSLVRGIASIANGGTLVTPRVLVQHKAPKGKRVSIAPEHLRVVREGMRLAVSEGTAAGLAIPGFTVAGKTGTAELGTAKRYVNSWVTGFFPYESPRYAFVVIMERGPRSNTIGGVFIMRQLLDWILINTPEYTKPRES